MVAFMLQMSCTGSLFKNEYNPRSTFQRSASSQEFNFTFVSYASATNCWIWWHSCPIWKNNLYFPPKFNHQNWPTQPERHNSRLWASQNFKNVSNLFEPNECEEIVYGCSGSWREGANYVKWGRSLQRKEGLRSLWQNEKWHTFKARACVRCMLIAHVVRELHTSSTSLCYFCGQCNLTLVCWKAMVKQENEAMYLILSLGLWLVHVFDFNLAHWDGGPLMRPTHRPWLSIPGLKQMSPHVSFGHAV